MQVYIIPKIISKRSSRSTSRQRQILSASLPLLRLDIRYEATILTHEYIIIRIELKRNWRTYIKSTHAGLPHLRREIGYEATTAMQIYTIPKFGLKCNWRTYIESMYANLVHLDLEIGYEATIAAQRYVELNSHREATYYLAYKAILHCYVSYTSRPDMFLHRYTHIATEIFSEKQHFYILDRHTRSACSPTKIHPDIFLHCYTHITTNFYSEKQLF
jgi:hypothetical protein